MAELPKFSRHLEIGVVKHDVDVRFFTGSGNTAVSRMRNASGHNYWNSSFIIDMAMGQIPRSTERISSFEDGMPQSKIMPNFETFDPV